MVQGLYGAPKLMFQFDPLTVSHLNLPIPSWRSQVTTPALSCIVRAMIYRETNRKAILQHVPACPIVWLRKAKNGP